jgi:acetylornithine/succinyldiaminopimelate/putrescine aminotransferase
LADKNHALLIFDEIQCGLGRTGDWFAYEKYGVNPDALILGKPLGGGVPLSALLVNDELFDGFGLSKHGSTLGGSPFACRLGLEFLSVVEDEGLLAHVTEMGKYLAKGLHALVAESPVAVEARGRGLLQGVEVNVPGRPIAEAGLERGFMLNVVQGNVIRFLPPFLLQKSHIDQALELLHELLGGATQETRPLAATTA